MTIVRICGQEKKARIEFPASSVNGGYRICMDTYPIAEAKMAVWSGTTVSYLLALYTQARFAFGNSTHVLS